MIDELKNLPEISFIDNMTLEDVNNKLLTDYAHEYERITGKSGVLSAGAAERIVLNSCGLLFYQMLAYIDRAGKSNLLGYSYGKFLDVLAATRGGEFRKTATCSQTILRFTISNIRSEVTAIPANFGWLVKDGELVTKTVERTSSDASRSMIGIKEDGTLVFCQVDGRNAPFSTGLSNYEMGEMMLALGCVNAVNCDGGGSSTFVSKREGETANTMRSVPSDGSERATINSVILASKAKATGEFDHAVLDADYDYYAPGTSAVINVQGVDAAGSPAALPESGIEWAVSDETFGTVSDGIFVSSGKKGDVKVQMLYEGEIAGEKLLHIVDPDTFALLLDETVLPYGKSMTVDFDCTYGADDWAVCVEGAYTLTLSDEAAATLNGNTLIGTQRTSTKCHHSTRDIMHLEYHSVA